MREVTYDDRHEKYHKSSCYEIYVVVKVMKDVDETLSMLFIVGLINWLVLKTAD